MPRVEQPRSPLTGELLSAETLEIAAMDHGINLAETSVGRMFDGGTEQLAAKKRQASLRKKANFNVGDRVKVISTNEEGTVDEVGEADVEDGEDNTYISVVGDDDVQLGGYQSNELVKIGSLEKTSDGWEVIYTDPEVGDKITFDDPEKDNSHLEGIVKKVMNTSPSSEMYVVDVNGQEMTVSMNDINYAYTKNKDEENMHGLASYAQKRRAKMNKKANVEDELGLEKDPKRKEGGNLEPSEDSELEKEKKWKDKQKELNPDA